MPISDNKPWFAIFFDFTADQICRNSGAHLNIIFFSGQILLFSRIIKVLEASNTAIFSKFTNFPIKYYYFKRPLVLLPLFHAPQNSPTSKNGLIYTIIFAGRLFPCN